ncbi:MAG TPA: flavodoxin-dependent (E)-4-hydroxy-3-methylbut-2-enyl-diphosphate synthase [Phycisphaerales bacterium]|nr:flavodoxin-dependent (E)-4-hydroxy-3-methylbut-2-enyl-diphosphate synthase [Phycisphaerales bacterium]HIB01267.1 flavodoxin-dependent (E)-4-hydroxy-3-methylbut-2-enyl-diphosphate synthase [Phycisphaerales bacterium]HIB51228.1 flavodoxin-dependent (E)-4-hydroxy-3-methylbut-2-enyl-diphosphate synthase [Phycisphaerales bacterium]HIN83580.1 flavodoxin-dependent (E)-4-hydroxy-3-methylbut-2-enyl-diphosphate synthase [Phycisphaerales bacterium]HIO20498.1 flavodoxin-dependent (E)-4-hydroxy-3-methylb
MQRRVTKQIHVGDIAIGGNAPVSVQSMTSGYTYEIDTCVAEINRLAKAGADIVRVAVPEKKDTLALTEILSQVSVPIVADVHFHFKRALEAIEAGVQKIRLNPGNIGDIEQVNSVIDACKDADIPIRIGVNEGSVVERKDKLKRQEELASFFSERKNGHLLAMMIAKVEEYLEIFDARDFHNICLSAKLMDARHVIDIYQELSKRFDYPLHLGVTHAGPRETGSIRSISAIGSLLSQGIGDTIRISYASDTIFEVEDGVELLNCLDLRPRIGAELIACPSCGRIQVDLFKLVDDVRNQLETDIDIPIKVAVMGCVVNGPGEAEGADVAVFAGDRRGIIYVQGERVANVSEDEILDRLLSECKSLQDRVRNGETKLGDKAVTITAPITVEGNTT